MNEEPIQSRFWLNLGVSFCKTNMLWVSTWEPSCHWKWKWSCDKKAPVAGELGPATTVARTCCNVVGHILEICWHMKHQFCCIVSVRCGRFGGYKEWVFEGKHINTTVVFVPEFSSIQWLWNCLCVGNGTSTPVSDTTPTTVGHRTVQQQPLVRPTLMRFLFTKTKADLFVFGILLLLHPYEKSIEQKQNWGFEQVKFNVNVVKWVMDVFSFPCLLWQRSHLTLETPQHIITHFIIYLPLPCFHHTRTSSRSNAAPINTIGNVAAWKGLHDIVVVSPWQWWWFVIVNGWMSFSYYTVAARIK